MRIFKRILLALLFFLLALGAFYYPKLQRVNKVIHFFDPDIIVENFRTTDQMLDKVHPITAAKNPSIFPKIQNEVMPDGFKFREKEVSLQTYLDSSYTTGFLVLQDDSIVYETYLRDHTANQTQIIWSVSKSFVSAMMGIAIAEGKIKSIEQKVEEYCPELKGSGYEGVRIKDVLQMSTGVGFNEDYADFWSDINRWGRGFAWGSSQDAFAASLTRVKPPGTYNHYVSINTHVLGMILVKATGKSLAAYAQEKIWEPLGMEHDSYWLVDDYDMEMALGGLNTTVRNCAKLGSLYLNQGNWQGRQIIPSDWIKASTTPDAPHLQPGDNPNSAHYYGYGYQWWIPESEEGEYLARGVYNQYIYVNPTTRTVIVKHSANPNYNRKGFFASSGVFVELCRTIARAQTPVPGAIEAVMVEGE